MAPHDAPFAILASARCPAYDTMLVAIEREFRPVDRRALDGVLDDLARPLFGLPRLAPSERVAAVTGAARAALPRTSDAPEAWLLSSALRERCGSDPIRAALAAELSRRAGVQARVCGACAHQLAFAVLSGLAAAWRSAGDEPQAERASRLRELLPLEGAR